MEKLSVEKGMAFDGPCPFLTCQKLGPHSHGICPKCGAVRFGNIFCETCEKYRRQLGNKR